jgi:hypothetical protein
MEDVVSQEKLLKTYIKENKKALAVKLLFELIVKHARANHFSKADALREKLFEVDPMALPEIVKSGEIIENAKAAAIDQDGRIVGIHNQMFNEYLTNVKWDKPLDNGIVERIKLMA